MATTAQWVFDKAIYLMDEQNEANGQTQTTDTREYEFRTLGILNILRHELYPISDTYPHGTNGAPAKRTLRGERTNGGADLELSPLAEAKGSEPVRTIRPICPEITDFTDEIGLDDAIAQGVMPYGLAAHLLLGENDAMANYFSQRYMEMYQQMRNALPSEFEEIPLSYGGLDC